MYKLGLLLLCSLLTACIGLKPHASPLPIPDDKPYEGNLTVASGDWWGIYHSQQLDNLITSALSDSPSMQMAASRLRQAKFFAQESQTTLWPSIKGYADLSRERISENSFFPPPYAGNSYTESNLGLNFTYELDFWGKNRSALAAKISEYYALQADLHEAKLVLASAVATSYIELQYNQALLRVAEQMQIVQQKLLNIMTDRAAHGVESELPITTNIANFQSANVRVNNLKQQVQIAEHQLVTLTGKNPFTTSYVVAPFHFDKQLLRTPQYLPAQLVAHRPDLQAARLRAERAANEVKVAKAQFFPNINLNVLLSLQSFTLSKIVNIGSRDNTYGAAIGLPIFDAGLRRANLGEKYSEYDLAIENYNQTLLEAFHQAADQLAIMAAVKGQLRAEYKAYFALRKNLQLSRLRYRHGIVDYANVLLVENNFLAEKNRLIDLQALYLTSTVSLIKALGGNYLTEA